MRLRCRRHCGNIEILIYQTDAFANVLFRGNPAGPACYQLRWFTPEVEVVLCGHATLAAASVI